MQKFRYLVAAISLGSMAVATAQASSVRLFFSTTGTADGSIHGDAVNPVPDGDPRTSIRRFWLWVSPIGENTTVNALAFRIVAHDQLNIDGYHFWNHDVQGVSRWIPGGFPGAAGDQGQATDVITLIASVTPGVTNGPLAEFDTQYDEATNSTVVGYVDFSGHGAVDILFEGGGIQAPNTYERTFLRLDDTIGNPGSGPYSTSIPEGWVVPEPASLLIFAFGALTIRRR